MTTKKVFSASDAAPVVLHAKRDADSEIAYPVLVNTAGQLTIESLGSGGGDASAANQVIIIGHIDEVESYLQTVITNQLADGHYVVVSGGTLSVSGLVSITGSTNVINTVVVTGSTTLVGVSAITGSTAVVNTVTVTGSTTVIGTVAVTGSTTVVNTVAITGSTVVISQPARDRTTDNVGVALQTDVIMNDTSTLTPKYAVIDKASSGDNTIVASHATLKIRVLACFMVAAGDVNVRFESGASGTALTGQMNLDENTGFVLPFNPVGWFETSAAALLNLELSAAVSVDGSLVYVEV